MSRHLSRKEFLRIAGLSAGGMAMAACAPAAPAPTVSEPVKKADEVQETVVAPESTGPVESAPVELEFVMNTSPGWDEAMDAVMGMFMELHPNISIKFTPIDFGQLTVVLPPRFAAKDPPDLLLTDCFWPWVQQGLVVDLKPLIDRDGVDLSLISDLGAGVLLGDPARYGLPFDFTGSVVGYNKTMFDKYGVEYPKKDWTTDQLQQASITLTRDTNDRSPADDGFDPNSIKTYGVMLQNAFFWGGMVNMWGGRLWSEDGRTCTFDSENGIEAFAFWNDLACSQHAVYGPQPTSQAGGSDPFVSQLAAISIEGEWQLALWKDITDFDFDVAAWPNGPRENWQYGASDALGIARDSKDIDAAWEFQKFWTWDKEAALVTGAIMPPALNELGLDEGILQARIGERGPTLESLVWAYSNMREHADGSVYYQGIRPDEWQPVFSEMLTTLLTLCNESVDPLVPDTAKQITDILQKT